MSIPKVNLPADARLATLAVREGLPPTPWGENSEALFLTSSFVHPDAATAARRFANEEEAFVYSRFGNPTTMMMERRLAAMEGTEALHRHRQRHGRHHAHGDGAAEGRRPRDLLAERVRLDHQAAAGEFGKFGVQTSFVSQTDPAAWAAAVQPNTSCCLPRPPSNPLTEVCDIAALADIAHRAGALLAVDNCFCSPALQQPVRLGPIWSSTPAPSTSTARAA